MNFLKKFSIIFLFLTSLNLTQNFAMEDGLHFGGGSSSTRSSSNSVNQTETAITIICSDGTIEVPLHLLGQSITLSQFADIGQESFTVPESFFPNEEIAVSTLRILKNLMQRAYDIAQSTVDLNNIIRQLSLDIQQHFPDRIEILKNISDFLHIPLISNACAHAFATDVKNVRNPVYFRLNNIYINKPELSLFDNITYSDISFSLINKLLGLNPKDLNFYQIFENCSSLELFCKKIIASPDNSIYLSNFLNQIPNYLYARLHARLVDQIEDILNSTEIGKKFSVVINSNVLYIDLTPKKFLDFLLVLSENKITPKLLDELAQNINSFTDYDQMVAKALLYLNNHDTKNDILNEFRIYLK